MNIGNIYLYAFIKKKKILQVNSQKWNYWIVWFSSVQSLSHVWLFAMPWTASNQASLSITNFHSLLKLMSIVLVMSSNHLIFCHPFLLLPSIFPCIRVFSNESVLHIKWPPFWNFSFSISPEWMFRWTGWISLQQGTPKGLIQHYISKASILWHSVSL